MKDPGHSYSFGSPSSGWPAFGPDGKIVREVDPELHAPGWEVCRSPAAGPDKLCVKMCGSRCEWAAASEVCPKCKGMGLVAIGHGVRGVARCSRCRPGRG